jgi:acetyl-CoA carboxylase biotin carboxyl carrier protein
MIWSRKTMTLDLQKIKELIELVQETKIAEIEIREGETVIHVKNQVTQPVPTPAFASLPMPPVGLPEKAPESNTDDPLLKGHVLRSPMVGTAYLAPSPGAKDFIELGQLVSAGDTICIIEAMKMFNPIEADKSGKITARLVENGQPVEFNQPLFIIE